MMVHRPQPVRKTPLRGQYAVIDRPALRHVLLELQDLRARQGADWRWMDSLHPSLRRELDAAIADEVAA